jgi:hypothetical protein
MAPLMSRRALFYAGLLGLALFEILKVYFIMPMPGSQRIKSLDFAYFLHVARWFFRIGFGLTIVAGMREAFGKSRKWLPLVAMALSIAVVWLFNFKMSADHMFKLPESLVFKTRADNTLPEDSVVIGVERNGEARAYPVRFLVYHHQVQDTVGGKPVLVTYCSVCRSGRVFEPMVDGRKEEFRLVGMDRFNAMFEDATTGSWWRQATGQAVTGPRKGMRLAEVDYRQVTLKTWFDMHPRAVVMQQDPGAPGKFDPEGKYERGQSKGDLTRTDPGSWQDKSWVIGVDTGNASKAYDWNRLRQERIINDELGGRAVLIALATDGVSYAAFVRPGAATFTIEGDVLSGGGQSYGFDGRSLTIPMQRLEAVNAHQEFWHSWRDFHPDTERHR